MADCKPDDLCSKARLVLQLLTDKRNQPAIVPTNSELSVADDSFPLLQDASERYQLWAGNLGALFQASDPRSLEHRLQHTPSVRQRVLELLNELIALLQHRAFAGTRYL